MDDKGLSTKLVGSTAVKTGFAEMFKGGVIMDVVNSDQAQIAEDAGLKVVMDRCPKIELFRPFWKPRLNQKI